MEKTHRYNTGLVPSEKEELKYYLSHCPFVYCLVVVLRFIYAAQRQVPVVWLIPGGPFTADAPERIQESIATLTEITFMFMT